MLSEEIISLNRMKIFARSNDLSVVTAKDMKIVVNLVENLQKEIEELKEKYIIQKGLYETYGISKDKIKAKIEEVDYKMIAHQDVREAVKQVLQSLLEKE